MSPFDLFTLDLETRHLAKDVGGWPRLMAGAGGISALVIHENRTGRYHCFNDHTLEDAARLLEERPGYLVTYNGKNFDVPLIQALLGRPLHFPPSRHFDLYDLIKSNLREGDPKNGCSLHEVCKRTLGYGKDSQAEHAPVLAAQGRWLSLFRYCKRDVQLTQQLFMFAREHGGVISHSGDLLPLPIPDWLRPKAAEAI